MMSRYQVIVKRTTEAAFTIEADTKNKNKLKIMALEEMEAVHSTRKIIWNETEAEMLIYEIMPGNESTFFRYSLDI